MPDLSNTTTAPVTACGTNNRPGVDQVAIDIADRFFVSLRRETFRTVKVQEAEQLTMPWGPRIDVTFHPKNTPGIVGGRVRLFARTKFGGDVELMSAPIVGQDTPVILSGSHGCDEYVVKAMAFQDPGPGVQVPEAYFHARVYDARR